MGNAAKYTVACFATTGLAHIFPNARLGPDHLGCAWEQKSGGTPPHSIAASGKAAGRGPHHGLSYHRGRFARNGHYLGGSFGWANLREKRTKASLRSG